MERRASRVRTKGEAPAGVKCVFCGQRPRLGEAWTIVNRVAWPVIEGVATVTDEWAHWRCWNQPRSCRSIDVE
jgi:hypothetical protein